MKAVVVVEGVEHVINGAKQNPMHLPFRPAALAESKGVVDKDIYVDKRLGLRRQRQVAASWHGH